MRIKLYNVVSILNSVKYIESSIYMLVISSRIIINVRRNGNMFVDGNLNRIFLIFNI